MKRLLETEFILAVAALALLFLHPNLWLSGVVVWGYMLSRFLAKHGRGAQRSGLLTRELYLGAYLVGLGFMRHQLSFELLSITYVVYALTRGDAKALSRPGNVILR